MEEKSGWIKVNLPLGPIYDFSERVKEKKSMDSILKPGMLLELKSGEIILVGDINTNGGVFDDCHYGKETIVKRYKQLNIIDLV